MGTVSTITTARTRGAVTYRPLLTPAEVAALFRVDPKTVTRWANKGKLRSIRTPGGSDGHPGHRRFFEDEVLALLEEQTP